MDQFPVHKRCSQTRNCSLPTDTNLEESEPLSTSLAHDTPPLYLSQITVLHQTKMEVLETFTSVCTGVDRFCDNVEEMTGKRPLKWFQWSWKFISPFCTTVSVTCGIQAQAWKFRRHFKIFINSKKVVKGLVVTIKQMIIHSKSSKIKDRILQTCIQGNYTGSLSVFGAFTANFRVGYITFVYQKRTKDITNSNIQKH